MGFRTLVLALFLCALLPGCLVLAITDTQKEQLEESSIDVRVTSRRADLSGASCYVQRNQRRVSRIEIPKRALWAGGGLLEALVGSLLAGTGSQNQDQPKLWGGTAMIVDGAAALVYSLLRQGKVVTSTRWVDTGETATCAF